MRTSTSEALPAIRVLQNQKRDEGVGILQGDTDDVESLKRASRGASAIFALTDFAGNFTKVSRNDALQRKAKNTGKSIHEYASYLETIQGINIATAASDRDLLSTLEKFIWSTLTGVKTISGGKYTQAYEFNSKAAVEEHIRDDLSELSKRLSTVNMGIYQENWKAFQAFSSQKESDGSFTFISLKWPGQYRALPEVFASQDTGAFVESLVLDHPRGTNALGASEIISRADYAALWGIVIGKRTTMRDVEESEYATYID
ncbi:hypothetical protein CC78DRAFT_600535 [Lojkania enalia]|uniref:NmrA-like domain-containing protein n=1 Tax=Lojkania enalia TaxID=147567 RepID=A0A9P4N6Q7_9PLEO|nr:hypothetical protein CC78DRAFT_600535 [Didymosphaeria enalia]